MDDRTAPAGATYQFAATIEAGRRGGALVRIPFDVREAFGTGDEVRVTLRRDTAMRTVDVPRELSAALAKSPEARRRYEADREPSAATR